MHLIGLISRGVTNIVVFENAEDVLQGKNHWDPSQGDLPQDGNMEIDIPSFFGISLNTQSHFDNCSWDYSRNTIFERDDFFSLAADLQDAQASGGGVIVGPRTLRTVENDFWGIPAAIDINVTFVYLSRVLEWESRLSSDMRARVVPSDPGAASDPSQLMRSGEFKAFPNYETTVADMTPGKARLLYELSGWVVKNNGDAFRRALGGE